MANQVRVGVGVTGAKKASSELDQLRDKFDKMQKTSAKGFAIGVGAGAALAGVNALSSGLGVATDFIFDSIDAASNLNETMSKSSVVFGEAADDVSAWGDRSAKAMGMSKNAAVGAAATFGNLFNQIGVGKGDVKDMSERFVTLAGDIASFNNIDPTEALEKLRSGLAGESEPLRSVGVFLTEAKVKAKAMEMNLKSAHGELSEGDKILARYQLILDETASAQGDFGRTSDQMANQQRILNAELEDSEAKLGNKLLPAVIGVQRAALGLLGTLDLVQGGLAKTDAGVQDQTQSYIDLEKAILPLVPFMGDLVNEQQKALDKQTALTKGLDDSTNTIVGDFDRIDKGVTLAADHSQDAIENMRGSFKGGGTAAHHMSATIKQSMGEATKAFRGLRDSMADDAQSMIDDYFDPIEERARLHETRLALHAAEEASTKAKTVEDQRQASSDIVDALDDEAGGLSRLGAKGKLTNKDIDKFAGDARKNYAHLSKDAKAKIDAIIAELRKLAAFKSVSINVRAGLNQGNIGNGGARALGGPVKKDNPYIVGERGEELFVPKSDGQIIPHNKLGAWRSPSSAGGSSMTLNLTVNAAPGMTPASARELGNAIGPTVAKWMQDNGILARGGSPLR